MDFLEPSIAINDELVEPNDENVQKNDELPVAEPVTFMINTFDDNSLIEEIKEEEDSYEKLGISDMSDDEPTVRNNDEFIMPILLVPNDANYDSSTDESVISETESLITMDTYDLAI